MFKKIAVINQSRSIPAGDVNKMVYAINLQIIRDVAPAWGKTPVTLISRSATGLLPAEWGRIYIYDNSDQADALGYHTVSGQQVWGTVFAKTILDYGCPRFYDPAHPSYPSVSSVLSHEAIELFVNPFVNAWAEGPAIAEGSEYALEACDAVEAGVYQISMPANGGLVSVSNFLYPEYFNAGTPSSVKMDQLGVIRAPFSLSRYGYMIVRSGPGQETAIFGAEYPAVLRALNEHAQS
jgi:hypothetical protein